MRPDVGRFRDADRAGTSSLTVEPDTLVGSHPARGYRLGGKQLLDVLASGLRSDRGQENMALLEAVTSSRLLRPLPPCAAYAAVGSASLPVRSLYGARSLRWRGGAISTRALDCHGATDSAEPATRRARRLP